MPTQSPCPPGDTVFPFSHLPLHSPGAATAFSPPHCNGRRRYSHHAPGHRCTPCHGKHPSICPLYFWEQCTSPSRLTILIRLEYHLLALLATLGVGEDELDVDVLVGQEVFDGVAVGVPLHLHALPEGLVVAGAHEIAVAERDGVGVTAGQVVAQWLPLQRQLSGLDFRERQAFGGPHGLWGGVEMGTDES